MLRCLERPDRVSKSLRAIAALASLFALFVLGCSSVVAGLGRSGEAPIDQHSYPAPHSQCPYASVYVAVSTDGSKRDRGIAESVRIAYSGYLAEQGFSPVDEPQDAYWSAFSMVGLSRRVESNFAWTVYMMARHDQQGTVRTPLDFASKEGGELSGYMLLREVRLVDIESQARRAAVDTATALLPHTNRMCTVWSQKLEALRRELVREMTRVRSRKGGKSRGSIELELLDPDAPAADPSGAEEP